MTEPEMRWITTEREQLHTKISELERKLEAERALAVQLVKHEKTLGAELARKLGEVIYWWRWRRDMDLGPVPHGDDADVQAVIVPYDPHAKNAGT